MTNPQTHPVAREAADALAASRARAEQNAAELAARIADRKREKALKLATERARPVVPAIEWIPRERPKPANPRLLEVEAQIKVYEAKLKRTKRPLGWARRQAMKQLVSELKTERKELKKR
jgi:hypothetical protein